MDLQFRSHQIIPDLSVHQTFHDVCVSASHRRPFLAPATLTTFTPALPVLKQTQIKNIQLQLITAVNMETTVFSYVTPCSVANFSER
jgi:hypothetical protein